MSPTRPIRRVGQIQALASPVRQEIADCLAAGGPMSVAELAAELGRTPPSLYFHVQRMLQAGLIETAGERNLQRHAEKLYAAARVMRVHYDLRDPDSRDAVSAMAASMQRVAARDFERGIESAEARATGGRRNLWAARMVAWVSAEELARLNALLESILDLLSTRCDETKTERVALQWTLTPVPVDRWEPTRPTPQGDSSSKRRTSGSPP
jgi:DNA-binding transcriptional ArsR family regulator